MQGASHKPPQLDKDLYDQWKSRIEIYIKAQPNGRRIWNSVVNGPMPWPTITENGTTRDKEFWELDATELLRDSCDNSAINIILQGVPPEIYDLVSQHKSAKEVWEKIELLMQGTSLSKQERECRLYDEFERFTFQKGETLQIYYKRFTSLLNKMSTHKMKLENFQVNTKFLNNLPSEWGRYVTDVKMVKDLHEVSVDQLNSHLGEYERHVIQTKFQQNFHQILLLSWHINNPTIFNHHYSQSQQFHSSNPIVTYPNDSHQTVSHNVYTPQTSIPKIEYLDAEPIPQTKAIDFPVFKRGDDPIDAINHMMAMLSNVVNSRYPPTNNQLRTSSNPRQQCYYIVKEELYLNQLRGEILLFLLVLQLLTLQTLGLEKEERSSVSTVRKKGICLRNAQSLEEEGINLGFRIRQCWSKHNRKGSCLMRKSKHFLADIGVAEDIASTSGSSQKAAYQCDDLDAYDSDIEDFNTAKVSLMASLSTMGSKAISEVPITNDNYHQFENSIVQESTSFGQINVEAESDTEVYSDSNIIPYHQYLQEAKQKSVQNTDSPVQQEDLVVEMMNALLKQVANVQAINMERANEVTELNAKIECYKAKNGVLETNEPDAEINALRNKIYEHSLEKQSLLQKVEDLKLEMKQKEDRNINTEIALEKHVKNLDKIIIGMHESSKAVDMLTKPHNLRNGIGYPLSAA